MKLQTLTRRHGNCGGLESVVPVITTVYIAQKNPWSSYMTVVIKRAGTALQVPTYLCKDYVKIQSSTLLFL